MPKQPDLRTGDQALIREINLSLVMNYLHNHAPISRAKLADMTGLNKSTMSSLVTELIQGQYVRELGLSSSGIGRPSVQLELNPHAGTIVSAEIGVDFITVICTNFTADVLWQCKEAIPATLTQDVIIKRMITLLRQAIEAGDDTCPECGGLLGVAVGVPGLIDQTRGMLLFAPNLQWQNVPLRAILRKALGDTPVFVDNEANLAALGECFFGMGQGYQEILYISAGVGLGGAMVRNSHLIRGKTGFASEFGHMTMNPDGRLCNCGNRGCWETLVSQSAVFRLIREAIADGQKSILTELVNGNFDQMTMQHVIEAADAGDPLTLHTLDAVGHALGIGIASLVNALNPDLVLLGGAVSLASKYLLPVVEYELEHRALRWNAEATKVVPAKHGFYACVMGGVAMVYQTILAQPGKMERSAH